MRKKIILINPPRYDVVPLHTVKNIPYGLLRIGGYLLEQGHDVKMIQGHDKKIDLTLDTKKKCGNFGNEGEEREVVYVGKSMAEIKKELEDLGKPDEIWVSSTMTYYWRAVHEVIDLAKETYPDVPVILGGIYASICQEHAKKSKADKIHKGPYLPAEKSRTALELLDKIPDYFIIKYTRGCPHKCSYCAVTDLEGHKMEFMDTDRFVEELEEKYEVFGINSFHLWESNLLVDAKNRFEKVLDKIIEKRLPIHVMFPEGLQPSLVYPELAWKMRKAGVGGFALPLESADEEFYKKFHKPSTLKQFDGSVKMFQDVGFSPRQMKIFVLIGMPDQTIESIVRSDFKVMGMRCRVANLRFTPIPGTEDYEKHKEFLKDKDLEDLHPALYPFANEKMTVRDLTIVHDLNGSTNLYVLVRMEDNNVSRIFKELVKKHVLPEKEIGEENKQTIQIIDNHTKFLDDKSLYDVINKANCMKSEGKYLHFYKPEPPCKFKKNVRSSLLIPTRCDQCLKLFVDGCEFHPIKERTCPDIEESFRLQEENMKSECKDCIHRKRGVCRVLCEQCEDKHDERK